MTAGTQYWLTIYSTGTLEWGWQNGTGGDNLSSRYNRGQSQWLQAPSNRAFSFNSAVPLPSAVWIFGTGLMSLLAFNKRKNKTAIF